MVLKSLADSNGNVPMDNGLHPSVYADASQQSIHGAFDSRSPRSIDQVLPEHLFQHTQAQTMANHDMDQAAKRIWDNVRNGPTNGNGGV